MACNKREREVLEEVREYLGKLRCIQTDGTKADEMYQLISKVIDGKYIERDIIENIRRKVERNRIKRKMKELEVPE